MTPASGASRSIQGGREAVISSRRQLEVEAPELAAARRNAKRGGVPVYPAGFEYYAPTTLDEALAILERYGDEAKVLAGGQSLIPVMKLRFAAPRALVDINRIE